MSEPLTPIVVFREGGSTLLDVDRWVVTADLVISFRLPQGGYRLLLSALGGELEYSRSWFSLLSGELEWRACRVRDWFRNNSVVIQAYSAVLWPWWHCPACGLEMQCPVERMNDGKCADCNEPFLPGSAPPSLRDQAVILRKGKPHPMHPGDPSYRADCAFCWDERAVEDRAEFFRLAATTGDPLLVDPSHPAVTKSPQCPWCYELDGMHLFGCVSERVRQGLEAEKAWKAKRR